MWIGSGKLGVAFASLGNTLFNMVSTGENEDVSCILEDNSGNLWMGFDGSVSNITNYNSEMRSNSILSFAVDNDKLFVGTSSGCYVYDITNHKFATPKVILDKLADEFITSLIVDGRGLVWMGTRNGAFVYASQKNAVYKASVGDGYTNNYIRSLVEDENQNIWASSDNGIIKISILPQNQEEELRFQCFSYFADDGLGDAHYFNNASCRTKSGLCLIGDFKGYTEIYPNKVIPEIHSGKTMFTTLYINEVLQSPTEDNPYIQENISVATEIKINHDDNITLFLSSMIPGSSQRIKFMYCIKERKDEWVRIPDDYVSLHGLSSGHYTLEVRYEIQGVKYSATDTEEKPVTNSQDLVEEVEEEEITVKSKDNKITLLIVEDNADSRGFLERSLNDIYNVLTAEDGKDAISVLRQNDVNIVVSDIMMPRMNGLELCNFIKKDIQFSHIPVVLLSAKSTEENIITGLRDGPDDYITKPYSLNILKLKIERILGRIRQNRADIITNIKVEPSKITVSSLDEEFIQKTNQIIEDNMQDANFSVVQLSSEIGMTRGNLYKKLMAISGLSPLEYIRTIRIKRGYSLLQQGKTNVSEVAYSVGYSSKQFSRYFKMQYGCLPSDFIKDAK
ncbi:MAG: response regulator [Bacteroidaceae bacterium]|nr:response regulator [Bacteroidaceae bacterium]